MLFLCLNHHLPSKFGNSTFVLLFSEMFTFYKRMQWNSANCMKYYPFWITSGCVSLQFLVFCLVFWIVVCLSAIVLPVILQFTDPDYLLISSNIALAFFPFLYFGHCINCRSSVYGFLLPFGKFKRVSCLSSCELIY